MRAIWRDTIIADSKHTVVVEGNHYFPPASVRRDFLKESSHRTTCPWKGVAHYYDIMVGQARNEAAAWCYPDPMPDAASIKDHVAFWKGVSIEEG